MLFRSDYHALVAEDIAGHPELAVYLERAGRLIERVNDWTRFFDPERTAPPRREELDLQILLQGIVNRCRKMASVPAQIDFPEPDADAVPVAGAVFQLQDVFMQLLTSRISTGRDLSLRIDIVDLSESRLQSLRSECRPDTYALVSLQTPDAPFELQTAEAYLDVVLSGFITADSSERTKDAITLPVYGMIREHDGDVFLNRKQGVVVAVGTALPISQPRSVMRTAANHSDQTPEGNETILLVDDEDMIWDVIIDMLQGLGYSVILAANGREAVEIYQANNGKIDLVILDMIMPEMTGSQAFYHLKELDPDVNVLLSSGYVGEEEVQQLLRHGAKGFLEKPYTIDELARRMRRILDV